MSDFSAFLKKNARPVATIKYAASPRFVDAEGKPIEWELAPIDTERDELIRRECTEYVAVGKRGQTVPRLDPDKYAGRLCVASTVFPNLNNAELQSDYGVMGGEALLKAMLNSGEYNLYKLKAMEVNGFNASMDEMIDDAKN